MDNSSLRTLLRTRSNRLRDSRIENRLTPPNRRLVSVWNEPFNVRARPTYPLTSLFPRYFALFFHSASCMFPNEKQTPVELSRLTEPFMDQVNWNGYFISSLKRPEDANHSRG